MRTFYSVEQVAQQLQVTPRTIRNYIKEGQLQGRKVGGVWRFTEEDLYQFIETTPKYFNARPASSAKESQRTFEKGEGCLEIDLEKESAKEIDQCKEQLLAEYNAVYSGAGRQFDYQLLAANQARVTLTGPVKYLLNFGHWIEKKARS